MYLSVRGERERERDRDRDRDRETERDRDRDRERQRETENPTRPFAKFNANSYTQTKDTHDRNKRITSAISDSCNYVFGRQRKTDNHRITIITCSVIHSHSSFSMKCYNSTFRCFFYFNCISRFLHLSH